MRAAAAALGLSRITACRDPRIIPWDASGAMRGDGPATTVRQPLLRRPAARPLIVKWIARCERTSVAPAR